MSQRADVAASSNSLPFSQRLLGAVIHFSASGSGRNAHATCATSMQKRLYAACMSACVPHVCLHAGPCGMSHACGHAWLHVCCGRYVHPTVLCTSTSTVSGPGLSSTTAGVMRSFTIEAKDTYQNTVMPPCNDALRCCMYAACVSHVQYCMHVACMSHVLCAACMLHVCCSGPSATTPSRCGCLFHRVIAVA